MPIESQGRIHCGSAKKPEGKHVPYDWPAVDTHIRCHGNARASLKGALVFEKDVELRPHAIDRYGRTVAMVFVDGRDVGLELIKAGLAWAYEHYLPEASPEIQAHYAAAETAARVSRLGLWQDNAPVPPWVYRKAEREQRAVLPVRSGNWPNQNSVSRLRLVEVHH